MEHPFGELLGLEFTSAPPGSSRCALTLTAEHLNPHGVAHGAAIFALRPAAEAASP